MKKISKVLLVIMSVLFLSVNAEKVSAKDPVKVYFFHSNSCGYCQAALEYFDSIEAEYGDKFDLVKYEVSSEENWKLLEDTLAKVGKTYEGVPFFVIGDQSFVGFGGDSDTRILDAIEKVYEQTDRYDVMTGEEIKQLNNTDVISYVVMVLLVAGSTVLLIVAKAKSN